MRDRGELSGLRRLGEWMDDLLVLSFVLFCDDGFDFFLALSSSFSLLVRLRTGQRGISQYEGYSGRKLTGMIPINTCLSH
jgi:hypothetical protein